jgi:hypothetical protein
MLQGKSGGHKARPYVKMEERDKGRRAPHIDRIFNVFS